MDEFIMPASAWKGNQHRIQGNCIKFISTQRAQRKQSFTSLDDYSTKSAARNRPQSLAKRDLSPQNTVQMKHEHIFFVFLCALCALCS